MNITYKNWLTAGFSIVLLFFVFGSVQSWFEGLVHHFGPIRFQIRDYLSPDQMLGVSLVSFDEQDYQTLILDQNREPKTREYGLTLSVPKEGVYNYRIIYIAKRLMPGFVEPILSESRGHGPIHVQRGSIFNICVGGQSSAWLSERSCSEPTQEQ